MVWVVYCQLTFSFSYLYFYYSLMLEVVMEKSPNHHSLRDFFSLFQLLF